MSDAEILTTLFRTGQLLHPTEGDSGIIGFAKDLHRLADRQQDTSLSTRPSVLEHLGNPQHIVFLLVDGLGMNFIEGMGPDTFIPRHVIGEMRSVFPSTTPTALTSLATGTWPAEHAVMGWHTFLPEIQAVSTIIRFQRCPDEMRLSKIGFTPAQVYPVPSQMPSPKGERQVIYLVPEEIAGTVYSQYWSAGAISRGYKSLTGAVNLALKTINSARGSTFTYLYMPQVDRVAHQRGTRHEETLSELDLVDKAVERLAAKLPADANLIITADHGHLDAEAKEQHALEVDDELLALCDGPPSGDVRLMYVTVRDGSSQAFEDLVHERYGDEFAVITTDEAEQMNLFGPSAFSPTARSRIGNTMLISTGSSILDFRSALGEKSESKGPKPSHHSGLTPDEMRVPLVII